MSHRTDPGSSDSAGIPWQGRSFSANPFGADDGSAPPALADALARFAAGQASQAEVVSALVQARLLIPLVADAGERGVAPDGRPVDKTQELSIVTVAGPDGAPVLPVFSSVAAMAAWRSDSRPVPAEARRVALAAVSEGSAAVVLDPGSESVFAVRAPALRAIAADRPWIEPWRDGEVIARIRDVAFVHEAVRSVDVLPGDPAARLGAPELVVGLGLAPGLDRSAFDALVGRVQESLAHDRVIGERVDSVALRVSAV